MEPERLRAAGRRFAPAAFFLVLSAGGCHSGDRVAPLPAGIASPPGFSVGLYAEGVTGARFLAVGPDSQIYLSQPRLGRVIRLPDRNRDGRAEGAEVVAGGLDRPHGLAFHDRHLYIAESSRIVRLYIPRQGGAAESLRVIIPDLPEGGQHWTRTVVVDPTGEWLYVAIGSSCNVCAESDPRRAAVVRYRLDGSGGTVYARGLRNAVGLAFQPQTGALWATDNGRDLLGDNLPPEEIVNVLIEGGDYGWPACYGNGILDPDFGDESRCMASIPPALTDTAHVAPLGCAFYDASQFPAAYRGDFFVACHGSWNRSEPVGYKVLRVHIETGRPVRASTFLGGFRRGGKVHGRPVDICVAPDGSLLVSDDYAGAVYRVRYGE